MLEKFTQENKAENIRRWLATIDLQSADILQTERDIYTALVKSNKKKYWLSTPIAPLAEPVDLNALVGDLLTDANEEIRYQASRLDDFYSWLSETNNVLKSEIETVEKAVTQATDDIQEITLVIGDENINFYWVSDSFNNNSFVDPVSTTLIDTDYGMATLGPQELQAIVGFTPTIDREVTNGIPGANLYIVNPGKRGLVNQEPQPILETTDTRNFGSIFDADPSTWFEVERNFIPPKQKMKMEFGRAFSYSESGEEKVVKEVTWNYDWKAIVSWPDGWQEGGPDGKGIELAEFRDLDLENPVATNALVNPDNSYQKDPTTRLAFNLVLDIPTSLSAIKLLPFTREDSSPITVETLEVVADGNTIAVTKDVELGTNRSTTRLQREILRRTGVQLVGSVFSIPTDRDISSIRVVLSSSPTPVKNNFAHIFKDVLTEYRTERNHVLWRSVNTWRDWGRVPYSTDVPKVTSSSSRPAIVGTLMGAAGAAYSLGKIFNDIQGPKTTNAIANALSSSSNGSVFGVLSTVAQATQVARIGGTLGAVGSWLGKAVPILGAILALDQLVGGFFSIDKSSNVLEGRVGYDIFKGSRSAVGLRDLTLVKTTYSPESILQSIKREFPGLVSKVGLFVDEYIPEHWGTGDWITYFVSVDGTTWTTIPKLTDSTLDKSLVLTTPTKTIFFKAILKGNTSDIYHSPALRHYSLQGLPS